MNPSQGKVWGRTALLWAGNNVEVHRIEGRAGGYCSRHRHAHKWNLFYVESGGLRVETWESAESPDVTLLGPGESCAVPPGRLHRFIVQQDCVALELYWVALDAEDIHREDCGGIAAPQTPARTSP